MVVVLCSLYSILYSESVVLCTLYSVLCTLNFTAQGHIHVLPRDDI